MSDLIKIYAVCKIGSSTLSVNEVLGENSLRDLSVIAFSGENISMKIF